MQDINQIQLSLLLLVRDISARYGLTCFLFGDALRGAVRKGDFLPDGQDIALLMPAQDLRNFCAYFQRESPKGVFLQNPETEKACPFIHTKLRQNGTTMMPVRFKDVKMHHGIGIDLYPYYPVDTGKIARWRTRFLHKASELLVSASLTPYLEKPGLIRKLILKIAEEKRLEVAAKLIKQLEKGNKKSMQVYTPFGGGTFFWREALGEETFKLTLGGESFRVPDRREVFLNMTGEKHDYGEMAINTEKGFESYGKPAKSKSKK